MKQPMWVKFRLLLAMKIIAAEASGDPVWTAGRVRQRAKARTGITTRRGLS
jgi:hypothetical protein